MVSRQMLWQTRLPPALHHKGSFAYECGAAAVGANGG